MAEKAGRNEFILKNGRSKKIIDLTKEATDSFPTNVGKSVNKFEKALKEANFLQTEDENIKNETIVRCTFNLHVANICLCTVDEKEQKLQENTEVLRKGKEKEIQENIKAQRKEKAKKIQESIEVLRNLIPEAKEYDEIIVPDICFHIGKGHFECEEYDLALCAFKQAEVENRELQQQEWLLRAATSDFILELETDEREVLKRLKEHIHLKLPKDNGSDNVSESYFDGICEVMELMCKYFKLQLKWDPEEAKKEGREMIKLDILLEEMEVGKKKAGRKITPTVLCDLGVICAQLKRYTDARKCFSMALEVGKDSEESDSKAQIVHNIAATLVLEHDFKKAVEEYMGIAAEDGTIKAKNQDLLLHSYLNWAFCHLRLEKTDDAYKYFMMAFDIALELDDMQGARKILEGLIATVLSLEKSVETMERYKLKLGLLDCDDVGRETAKSAKQEIDDALKRSYRAIKPK